MAGSRRWFGYKDGQGNDWAVELDESTYENAAFGFTGVASSVVASGRIIRSNKPVRMRYVLGQAINASGETVRRKFYCGDVTAPAYNGSLGTVIVDGVTYSITSTAGEKRMVVPAFDTAITDGDVDANFAI